MGEADLLQKCYMTKDLVQLNDVDHVLALQTRCFVLGRLLDFNRGILMQPGGGRSAVLAAIVVIMWGVAALAVLATFGFAGPAQALPSFARQTGQPCGTCHTDFPALTPFGRSFKLRGYIAGGGQAEKQSVYKAGPRLMSC